MRKIKYIKSILIILIVLLMLFQGILMNYLKYATYIDEFIVMVFLVVLLRKGKIIVSKYEKKQMIILILVILWGVLSNIVNTNKVDIKYIIIDIFAYTKIFIIYFSTINIINSNEKNFLIRCISKILKLITIIFLFFGIINLFFNVEEMTYDTRYGIRSYKFLYNNPGGLMIATLVILLFLLADMQYNKVKNNTFFIICLLITMVLTLRAISLATVIAFLGLYYIFVMKKRKINIIYWIIGAILIIFIGFPQIQQYLMNDETPRAQLIKYGFVTANSYFPFGAGFATYGSDVASENYSYLYEKYGFNERYGLSEEQGDFLNDNFWPMIIGELGYIGAVGYCYLIYFMYKNMKFKSKDKEYIRVAVYTTFAYILISSTGSKILVHYMGPLIFLTLGIILSTKMDKKNIIMEENKI